LTRHIQLADYYDFAKQEAVKTNGIVPVIYYLTREKRPPSPASTGNQERRLKNDDIRCITFKDHILPWLEKCIAYNEVIPITQDVLQRMIQLRDNIVNGFALSNDKVVNDELLDAIRGKLPDYITWTECIPPII
jgi:hypothetical protein